MTAAAELRATAAANTVGTLEYPVWPADLLRMADTIDETGSADVVAELVEQARQLDAIGDGMSSDTASAEAARLAWKGAAGHLRDRIQKLTGGAS